MFDVQKIVPAKGNIWSAVVVFTTYGRHRYHMVGDDNGLRIHFSSIQSEFGSNFEEVVKW